MDIDLDVSSRMLEFSFENLDISEGDTVKFECEGYSVFPESFTWDAYKDVAFVLDTKPMVLDLDVSTYFGNDLVSVWTHFRGLESWDSEGTTGSDLGFDVVRSDEGDDCLLRSYGFGSFYTEVFKSWGANIPDGFSDLVRILDGAFSVGFPSIFSSDDKVILSLPAYGVISCIFKQGQSVVTLSCQSVTPVDLSKVTYCVKWIDGGWNYFRPDSVTFWFEMYFHVPGMLSYLIDCRQESSWEWTGYVPLQSDFTDSYNVRDCYDLSVLNYDTELVNSCCIATLLEDSATFHVTWLDGVWRSNRPDSLTLKITDDLTGKSNTLTLNAPQDSADAWSCSVELPTDYVNNDRNFTASLTNDEGYGYDFKYEHDYYNWEATLLIHYGGVCINWKDDGGWEFLRPVLLCSQLLSDPAVDLSEFSNIELNASNNWAYSINGLPKLKDGKVIEYSTSTPEVDGYTFTSADNLNWTASLGLEAKIFQVSWNDGDWGSLRPTNLQINFTDTYINESRAISFTRYTYSSHVWRLEVPIPSLYTTDSRTHEISLSYDGGYGYQFTPTGNYNWTAALLTTDVGACITWKDDGGWEFLRPDQLSLQLKSNPEFDMGEHGKIALNSGNGWSSTIEGLPQMYDNADIEYTIVQPTVDGYTLTSEDNLKWTRTLSKSEVEFNVTWIDGDWDEIRPAALSLFFTDKDGENKKEFSLSAPTDSSNVWSTTEVLPSVYTDKKRQFETSLTQSGEYGYVFNHGDNDYYNWTATLLTSDVGVSIIWKDDAGWEFLRPDQLSLRLKSSSGLDLGEHGKIALNSNNGWNSTIEGLPQMYDNAEIVYSLVGPYVDGYTFSIEDNLNWGASLGLENKIFQVSWNDGDWGSLRPTNLQINFTDTYINESRAISFTGYTKGPYVWRLGVPIPSLYTTNSRNHKISLSYDGGYGYKFTPTGNYNWTAALLTTDVGACITWKDDGGWEFLRPDQLSLQLKSNPEFDMGEHGKIALNSGNNWSNTIEGLPQMYDNADIEYTIVQPTVDGYTFTSEDNLNWTGTFNFSVVELIWADDNNSRERRPETVPAYKGRVKFFVKPGDFWVRYMRTPSILLSNNDFDSFDYYSMDYKDYVLTFTYDGKTGEDRGYTLYDGSIDHEDIDGLELDWSKIVPQSSGSNTFDYNNGKPTFLVKDGNSFDLKINDLENWWFEVVPDLENFKFTMTARGYAVTDGNKKYKTLSDAVTSENGPSKLTLLKNIDIESLTLSNTLHINTDKWTLKANSITADQGATIIVNNGGTLELGKNKNVVVKNEDGGRLAFN